MPYDQNKTKNLLSIVGAFSGQPGGEFIADLGKQLRDAEDELKIAGATVAQSERDRNKATADLEAAHQTIMRLRSGTTGYTEMLIALQAIAKSPKGAQKIAVEAVNAATGVKTVEAAKA